MNIKSLSYLHQMEELFWNNFEPNLAYGFWMHENLRISHIQYVIGLALVILKEKLGQDIDQANENLATYNDSFMEDPTGA